MSFLPVLVALAPTNGNQDSVQSSLLFVASCLRVGAISAKKCRNDK